MNTPICDFVRNYAQSGALRCHMPGHKGEPLLGFEPLDVTEIDSADSLYEASGIIRESEENASALFGCDTFYSTEGSSQCIRAMLFLASLHAKQSGRSFKVLAGRNAHKTFLSAAALLDVDVDWLLPDAPDSYLSCPIDAEGLDRTLQRMADKPTAVYLTSPDYLGHVVDVAAVASVCHRHGALLLIDNAHGAYLKFLPVSRHPIDLGADLCCDSAHKTLPALTGAAYLHLSGRVAQSLRSFAKNALALFGSTSPSYLILQSLDAVNQYLADSYRERLADCVRRVASIKRLLTDSRFTLCGDEALKLTIDAKKYGYEGTTLAHLLQAQGIVCEFADPDYLVLMIAPETGESGLRRLADALLAIERKPAIGSQPPVFRQAERVLSIRQATLALSETLPVAACEGRVLAQATVGCPPAVPIVVCGERINRSAIDCFGYYGIETCAVVRE